jgi:hypothetical protein
LIPLAVFVDFGFGHSGKLLLSKSLDPKPTALIAERLRGCYHAHPQPAAITPNNHGVR